MARPAAKRSSIEQAAISLFARKGLTSTTIKDIAASAGVTEGALYRHYSGKIQMAWELYRREVEVFLAGLSPILDQAGPTTQEKLLAAVRFIYQYYKDAPETLVFVLLARRSFPQKDTSFEPVDTDPDDVIQRFIEREMPSGRSSKSNAVLLTAMLRGVVLEPILMHRDGRLRSHPTALAEKVGAACVAILKGLSA